MSRGKQVVKDSWDAAPNQPFVSVLKPTLKEPAWLDMSFGARCLYIAVKSFFNGKNNGRIYFGVRKAAAELGASRSSTERWFKELQEHGFIVVTQGAYLGADGKASANYWRLTEIGSFGERPTREFQQWKPSLKNKTPTSKSGQTVPKIGTGCPENRDECPENRDGLSEIPPSDRPDNRVIDNVPWKREGAVGGTARQPASQSGQATGATRRSAVRGLLAGALSSVPLDSIPDEKFPKKHRMGP